jgi:hypothetical protein
LNAPPAGANCVLRVCVGHVSHLRRLITLYAIYPALTRWANLCRAYGAREGSLGTKGTDGMCRSNLSDC